MPIHYRCWLCYQSVTLKQSGICTACLQCLPKLPLCCTCCGLPIVTNENSCHFCKKSLPYWNQLVAVSDYCEPLKTLINQFKTHRQAQLAKPLARLLLLHWLMAYRQNRIAKIDILVPVPLHKNKQWRRGFNQTALISKPLAHWLQCDYRPFLLTRHLANQEQKLLSAKDRKRNITNNFRCHADLNGKHIAVVDDIVTTGSTVNEISRLLLNHGAASIQIICLCRTL